MALRQLMYSMLLKAVLIYNGPARSRLHGVACHRHAPRYDRLDSLCRARHIQTAQNALRRVRGLRSNFSPLLLVIHINDKLHRSGFGYWTDVVAVATGEVDMARF